MVVFYVVNPVKVNNYQGVAVFYMLPITSIGTFVFESKYYFFKYLAYVVADRNLPKFPNLAGLIMLIIVFVI